MLERQNPVNFLGSTGLSGYFEFVTCRLHSPLGFPVDLRFMCKFIGCTRAPIHGPIAANLIRLLIRRHNSPIHGVDRGGSCVNDVGCKHFKNPYWVKVD